MAEYRTITVNAALSDQSITVGAELATTVAHADIPYYTGAYTVTPSAETQTLATAAMVMTENVVINPIPSNYGLITWDGSVLTVS